MKYHNIENSRVWLAWWMVMFGLKDREWGEKIILSGTASECFYFLNHVFGQSHTLGCGTSQRYIISLLYCPQTPKDCLTEWQKEYIKLSIVQIKDMAKIVGL